jgi:hypothetical protein
LCNAGPRENATIASAQCEHREPRWRHRKRRWSPRSMLGDGARMDVTAMTRDQAVP